MTDQLPALATSSGPLPPLLFALGFVVLSLALGRHILGWLGLAERHGATTGERAIAALALGAGALQIVPFALGAVGLLSPLAVRLAIGVVALLCGPELVRMARHGWALRQKNAFRARPWLVVWMLALSVALGLQVLLALVPVFDADGVIYHLTVPKRWLASGWLEYLPTYPYSNAPMGVEMLYGIGLAFAGDAAAKCIHVALGIAAAVALYFAGRRLRGSLVGALCATLFLVGPLGVVGQLGSAYIEGATAFPLAAASATWLIWFQTRERAWLRTAALLSGVAVSFKLTSALFPVAMLALTFFALASEPSVGRSVRVRARRLALLLPLVALPVLPWFGRAVLMTGNPLFPALAELIPSRDLSPDSAAAFDRYNRYLLWGTNLGASWTLERRELALLVIGVVLSAAVGLAVLRLRSTLGRATAVVFLLTILAQMYAVGLYLRYWVPMAAVLVLPLMLLLSRARAPRWMPGVLVAFTLVSSAYGAYASVSHGNPSTVDFQALVRTAAGVEDRRAFLDRYQNMYPIYASANAELPPDARILLSSYCSGFYIDRTTYCGEFVQDAIRFTTWDEFSSDLQRLGVTHVVAPTQLATGAPVPRVLMGSVSLMNEQQRFALVRRLLTTEGHLVVEAGGQGLYALDGGVTARTP